MKVHKVKAHTRPLRVWITTERDDRPTIWLGDSSDFADLRQLHGDAWVLRLAMGRAYTEMEIYGTLKEAIQQANAILALEGLL